MKIKSLKKIIISVMIIIIIIIISIIILSKKNTNFEIKPGDPIIEEENTEDSENIRNQISRLEYNTINTVINQYIQSLNMENTAYYGKDENGNFIEMFSEEEKKQNIIALLSENYIKINNISTDNLGKELKLTKENMIFVPLKMKKMDSQKIMTYVVQGITESLNYEIDQEVCFIVNMDTTNFTFSIEPTSKNYNNITQIEELDKIEKNDNNTYRNISMKEEQIATDYINLYKRYALGNPQIAYNYLDEEYRNKRFGSLENYQAYIEKNKEEIRTLQVSKYLVNNYEDYTQYICQDKYENLYIFNEKAIMDFTLQLDTYTIPTEKFINTYESANEKEKVMMNIDAWIKMLNNRDYTAAYNVLDETYRNDKFGTEEEFEEVIRNKLPLHYKAQYGEFSEEKGTYIQKINLTDITEQDENNVQISIIMQLKEDTDFVMSFTIEEEE